MVSVTQRIKQIKQPRGGYLNPNTFSTVKLSDKNELFPDENISPALIGICVDYLTRYMGGTLATEAFKVSLLGAKLIGEENTALSYLGDITGLDEKSIINACKLSGYDAVYRAGMLAYKPVENINPDSNTIVNIRIMVERSLDFFEQYGPVIKDGFTLEAAYTDIITSGDGDFLTADTLWDFKVSKRKPTKDQTLQLLIYYIMGRHSICAEFQAIKHLGIYNPRQNTVFILDTSDIPDDIVDVVSTEIIGY